MATVTERGRDRKTEGKKAVPGEKAKAARAPEKDRPTEENSESNQPGEEASTGQGATQLQAHLGNALMHPGLALIPTGPGLDACLTILVQPLLQGIQHCLRLCRGHLKRVRRGHEFCLPLPRSPWPPLLFHHPVLPEAAGMLGAVTGCTLSTAGGRTEGAVGALEASGRVFRSEDPEQKCR